MQHARSGQPIVTAMVVAFVLVGCGSTHTVTVNTPPPTTKSVATTTQTQATKPATTEKQATNPSTRTCSPGVTVNEHASCAFAERVLAAYAKATKEPSVTLGVESPETHQSYTVTCSTGEPQGVVCHTTNAVVTLSPEAVRKASSSPSPSFTSTTCPHGIVAFATDCAFASRVADTFIKEEDHVETSAVELSIDGQKVLCKKGAAIAEVVCSDQSGASIGFSVVSAENGGNEPGPPTS